MFSPMPGITYSFSCGAFDEKFLIFLKFNLSLFALMISVFSDLKFLLIPKSQRIFFNSFSPLLESV